MRILLVKRDASVAGDTTYLLMLAQGLVAHGHEVVFASGHGKLVSRFRDSGVRWWWTPPYPLAGPLLTRRAKNARIEAVVTTGRGNLRWAAYATARALGVPCVATLQDHIEPRQRIEEYEAVDAIVAVERPILERAEELSAPGEKLHLWPRPVFGCDLGPAPREGFPVLWMNRMSGGKAWSAEALLEAAGKSHQQIPEARLTLVGGGSRAGKIRRRAAQVNHEIGSRIIRVEPFTLDPLAKMQSAALVIGGGYTCLEAIYNGRPAIAAGFGYQGPITSESISEGYDKHFGDRNCPRGDAESLAEAIVTCHASIKSEKGASPFSPSRDWFTLDHSLSGQAKRLEQLISEIGGSSSARSSHNLAA